MLIGFGRVKAIVKQKIIDVIINFCNDVISDKLIMI